LTEKVKVIKCPGCGKLVFADKSQMDEHFASGHEKNTYTPPRPGSTERTRILGLSWHQQIRMIFQDYPEGILFYTLIILVLTFIISRVIELR